VLRRYGFGFVARGRRERVFDFTFFFFERLDIPLNYFSLFWRGKIREKGLFYFCRAHLFPAPGDVLEKVQRPSNARKKTSRDVFFLVRAVFG